MSRQGYPKDARRVDVTLNGTLAATSKADQTQSGNLSTGKKVTICVGVAALLGCYKLDCFYDWPGPAAA